MERIENVEGEAILSNQLEVLDLLIKIWQKRLIFWKREYVI